MLYQADKRYFFDKKTNHFKFNTKKPLMKIPKSIIAFSIALTASLHCPILYGQEGLIPKPLSITAHEGGYTINKNTKIFCSKEANKTASILAEVLRKSTGYKLPIAEPDDTKEGIHIILTNKIDSLGKEGYKLESHESKSNPFCCYCCRNIQRLPNASSTFASANRK